MSTWFTGSLVSRWIISHSLSSMKRVAFIYFMLVSVYWLISYFPLYFSLFLENCPVRMELYKHLCLYTAGRRSWLIWKQEVFFFCPSVTLGVRKHRHEGATKELVPRRKEMASGPRSGFLDQENVSMLEILKLLTLAYFITHQVYHRATPAKQWMFGGHKSQCCRNWNLKEEFLVCAMWKADGEKSGA